MAAAGAAVHFFECKLKKALEHVQIVLDQERELKMAGNHHHKYQDKYCLIEHLTNMAAASQVNCLAGLGLRPETVAQLCAWASSGAVCLRFRAEERCAFLREETREVEEPRKHVTEVTLDAEVRSALTSKVVTTVTEYVWQMEVQYELLAVRGVGGDAADRVLVLSRQAGDELRAASKTAPWPSSVPRSQDVEVTWLFRQLEELKPRFRVDRSSKACRTPCRNPDIKSACDHFRTFAAWSRSVVNLLRRWLAIQPDPRRQADLKAADDVASIFVPVLPLLQPFKDGGTEQGDAPQAAAPEGIVARISQDIAMQAGEADQAREVQVVDDKAANRLLTDEKRTLFERRAVLAQAFPSGSMISSVDEASLIMVLQHCGTVCEQWSGAVDYVEDLLRKQLIAAIGKEVSPVDFAEYMRFHSRKLFAGSYAPSPFCFAVRRSARHSPEGTVSIEREAEGPGGDSNISQPIFALSSRGIKAPAMNFALGASTTVTFLGNRFLHAWLSHRFSGQSGARLRLVSKARQFSSMIVLVGRITSATTFDPKYAAIVQNKDELTIPLELSTIPSAKEFRDAIESLSPEQQAFAKAYRAMQIESTLFGILVIQIKPQLEKVLNLPEDSLTKELQLTQDLMQLFIKYQIPSDILSYDGQESSSGNPGGVATRPGECLEAVKAHVKAIHEMIWDAKSGEIGERRMERRYRRGARRGSHTLSPSRSRSRDADRETRSGKKPEGGRGGGRGRGARDAGAGIAAAMTKKMGGGAESLARVFGTDSDRPRLAAMKVTTTSQHGDADGRFYAHRPNRQLILNSAEEMIVTTTSPYGQETPIPKEQLSLQLGTSVSQPAPQVPQKRRLAEESEAGPAETAVLDYTKLARDIDKRMEALDSDGALHPTIITPGKSWTKSSQHALLASPTTSTLGQEEQKKERDAAFDLLDALTKSGGMPIETASLHVVIAATHCFDKTVTETVIQDNINPIHKVERSTLLLAASVHQQPPAALIQDAQLPRVRDASPMLFVTG